MNKGTKLRTILRVFASLQNTAVVLTASVQAFASEYHIGWQNSGSSTAVNVTGRIYAVRVA